MKRTLLISAGVVVLLLVSVLVLPRFIDVDRHRPRIEKALADATGREVKLGKVGLAIFPSPALHAAGLTIGEDPRFGTKPFLESGSISVNVALLPLLRGRLEIGMLTIDAPKVRIVRGRSGWNLASLVSAPAEGAAGEGTAPSAAGSPP
ncbi:MAG TPA: AsmA family protein, partial [Candidatus Saccharimonadales bacterium]|nr:AsmA family protein [Candidatus Saccharimonadales bacterium]